jgi:large subunit ribosomal protein L3
VVSATVNLQVVKVDAQNNILAIKGALPGPRTGIVRVEVMK